LNLGAGFAGTALTSFNASAVTLGSVTYTSGVLASASTITGGAGADTLSAAAAVATVSLVGGAGIDTLTGSATKASTIDGGAGNDILTGGAVADSIVGGDGTDTFVFSSTTVVEQVGSSTTTGVVINLSAAAITAGDVNAAVGGTVGLTGAQTSVASNTATYLYSAESNTNASVIDTLTSIENATGTELADYIVGSADANVLDGAAGTDIINGGSGNDTITGGAGADSITGGVGADTYVWQAADIGAAGDVDFVVGTAGDKVVGFTTGSDILKFAASLVTSAAGTEVDTLKTIAAAGTVANTDRFVEITGDFGDGTTGDAITVLNALTTTAVQINDSFIAFMNDGTNGYLFLVEQISAANTIAAQDVTLIGQLTGITDIANGDFVSF
jgi:Ca2+-binding RTX toxin-like protein